MISFTVPGRPQGKGRPRMRKDGHVFTPAATVKYENLVSHCASVAMAGRALMSGPLILEMLAYVSIPASWPNKRQAQALYGVLAPTVKPDGDNLAKIVDALNGVVFLDDRQIVDWRIRKFYGTTPRLEISIRDYFEAQES